MAINAYHSGDDGLPAYASNNTGAQNFNSFKILVLACLVNGYGSRAAAGWELIAEGSNYLVLRTGSHSGYVGFQFVSNGVRVWLAQTYAGMSGSVMTGDGLKSGTAANNSVPQYRNLNGIAYTAVAGHAWVAVADENTAIFNFSGIYSGTDIEMIDQNGAASGGGLLYFGEDASGNIVSIGGQNTTSTPSNGPVFFDSRAFTALKNPATGLLVDTGSINLELTPGLRSSQSAKSEGFYGVFPNAVMTPASWGASGVWTSLRGVVDLPQLSSFGVSSAAQALGFPGAMTFGMLNTPLPLDDEHGYWMAATTGTSSWQTATRVITTNPEFW